MAPTDFQKYQELLVSLAQAILEGEEEAYGQQMVKLIENMGRSEKLAYQVLIPLLQNHFDALPAESPEELLHYFQQESNAKAFLVSAIEMVQDEMKTSGIVWDGEEGPIQRLSEEDEEHLYNEARREGPLSVGDKVLAREHSSLTEMFKALEIPLDTLGSVLESEGGDLIRVLWDSDPQQENMVDRVLVQRVILH